MKMGLGLILIIMVLVATLCFSACQKPNDDEDGWTGFYSTDKAVDNEYEF